MIKEIDMAELAGVKRDSNQLPPFWREVPPFYCSSLLLSSLESRVGMMKEMDMAELAGVKRDANQLPPFWREVPLFIFLRYCSRA